MVVLWALVMLLLGAASALDVARRARGSSRVAAEPAAAERVPDEADLTVLTDPELSYVWRSSRLRIEALEDRDQPAAVALLAGQRSRYLDEFERRDPDGFRCWLGNGETDEFPTGGMR